jgi:hypothetical protein
MDFGFSNPPASKRPRGGGGGRGRGGGGGGGGRAVRPLVVVSTSLQNPRNGLKGAVIYLHLCASMKAQRGKVSGVVQFGK